MVAKQVRPFSMALAVVKSPVRRGGLSMHGGCALIPCNERAMPLTLTQHLATPIYAHRFGIPAARPRLGDGEIPPRSHGFQQTLLADRQCEPRSLAQRHVEKADKMQTNTIATLKDQARRLRADLTKRGHDTTHSQALEMLAHQMGQRDWNTLAELAQRATAPAPLTLGARIAGRYLGQDVAGTVLAIAAHAGLTRLTIKLDEPVDVVRFDSFSSLRRRITVSLNDAGVTPQRTSDGQPHFVRLAA